MSGRLDLASWMFHVFEVMCAHLEVLALRLYIVRGLGRDLLLSTRVASLSLLHGLYLSSNVLKSRFSNMTWFYLFLSPERWVVTWVWHITGSWQVWPRFLWSSFRTMPWVSETTLLEGTCVLGSEKNAKSEY